MLINRNTRIEGENVVLVPYRREHVLKYHEWMKSEELQKLTASEPLTLEEEYQMQESWMRDANKCTFIILHKAKYLETKDEVASMIGDTNLFFCNLDASVVAEAEIMIAEPWAREKKCGWHAMLLMLLYGITYLDVKEFVVKISLHNDISIKMFSNMGFIRTSVSSVFEEVTMNKIVDTTWVDWLKQSVGPFEVTE